MVWFDFGGVLSPPMADIFAAYERKTGLSREQLESAMHAVTADLGRHPLAALEVALITEAEWGRRLRAALRVRYPGADLSRSRLETFGGQWFDGIEANHAMVATLHAVREHGCRVGILTNNVREWEPYWREIVRPVGDVDCVVNSCEVGVRKPEPAIFRMAADAAGVAPEDCVLVDDVEENCAAARSLGWRAVHHRTDADARDLLFALIELETP
ncbi:HAD family hydrolase [Dactylosporangium sucinum]|uniref:Haloacid dehalogenase n=1 Tax=Dactylosporangium sucinum TaxID=1424081 RepID=A0A917SZJ5_9ACTN|nr:HAD family phosphatase [Dactylosporangium sucinum]GGM04975.1 haloacid dehalogenase [Dactylosporangium sucinum]